MRTLCDLRIMPAVPEDACGIQAVQRECWLHAYPSEELGITQADIKDYFRKRYNIVNTLKHYLMLHRVNPLYPRIVAKVDDEVIGFCYANQFVSHIQLQMLYVHPEYQNIGIGSALWNETKKCFESGVSTRVRIARHSAQALAFFEGLGFVHNTKPKYPVPVILSSTKTIHQMEMIRTPDRA